MAKSMMKKKPSNSSHESNSARRNGKAWKVRPCGSRHAFNDNCTSCSSIEKGRSDKARARAAVRSEARILAAARAAWQEVDTESPSTGEAPVIQKVTKKRRAKKR